MPALGSWVANVKPSTPKRVWQPTSKPESVVGQKILPSPQKTENKAKLTARTYSIVVLPVPQRLGGTAQFPVKAVPGIWAWRFLRVGVCCNFLLVPSTVASSLNQHRLATTRRAHQHQALHIMGKRISIELHSFGPPFSFEQGHGQEERHTWRRGPKPGVACVEFYSAASWAW